ncbi:MAG: class I SAM-dependent methyltransferase [Bacteroidia bacterium]|nr:class I SAM-dependent methyltransferase [Bacteroidia bacterium]
MSLFGRKKFENPAKNSQGEFEVNNWITSEFIVQKLVPVVGVHPFPLDELSLMTATVCRFRPELIFEWGTNIGKSARIFLEIVNAFEIPSHIHSIDLPDEVFHNEHPKNDRGKLVRGMKGVTLHQADGVTRALEIIAQQKPAGKLLFLVDGDHSYESVYKELAAILDAQPDAVVLLHDTFYQVPGSNYNTGPHDAIKAVLSARGNAYRTISTQLGLPGMTLVYK